MESVFLCVVCGDFVFQAEDGIRDLVRSRGLGDVYKRQRLMNIYNRPIENIIPWFLYFYGNDNSLWRYLPGIENVEQLDVNFIQNWNLIYDVSFTDIIRSCQRSRFQSTDDKDLYNIIFNSKVFESLLNPKSNIDKLYFTSGKWQAQILNGNAKLNALKLF